MRSLRKRLTYANVMSTLAALFALGGGVAYAANTIASSEIIDGEVKTPDLAANAVNSAKIADGQVPKPTSDRAPSTRPSSRTMWSPARRWRTRA